MSINLDVDGIKFVINFDYPQNSEDYIHRIGRTGRSEAKGTSYAFFTDANMKQAKDLVAVLREANQVRRRVKTTVDRSESFLKQFFLLSISNRKLTRNCKQWQIELAISVVVVTDVTVEMVAVVIVPISVHSSVDKFPMVGVVTVEAEVVIEVDNRMVMVAVVVVVMEVVQEQVVINDLIELTVIFFSYLDK